jgi:acetylglutamate kinase
MIVIKFGGHAMADEHGQFAQSIANAIAQDVHPVIVHGGGPQIAAALNAAQIESTFVGGFRVTTPESYQVVERVLTQEVGPSVAQSLQSHGVKAVALSARAEKILFAQVLDHLVDGTSVDLGLVGEVVTVNTQKIESTVAQGFIPVIAPVAENIDGSGGLNVNADLAAAAIAGALDAEWLIIMTDVAGIYRNWPDADSLISQISANELASLKASFSEGMAPKVQACLDAIEAGANAVRIIDGTNPSALESALLGIGGTLVMA